MTSSPRRVPALLLLFTLFAGACGGSSGEEAAEVAETAEPAGPSTDANADEAADAATDPVATSTSVPVPDDDPAAAEAIAGLTGQEAPEVADADPSTTAIGFVQSRFNIDPDPIWVRCMVAETTRDDALDLALRTPSVGRGEVDDTQLKALTAAMAGCIEGRSLGDWATIAVGPQGEVRDTAPACFAERFDDPERGDVVFYTFTALTYQFRVEPQGVPDVIDALVTCAPIHGLTDFFAGQAETESNFEVFVDRDCLAADLAGPAVSELFWTTLIEGLMPPIQVVTPYVTNCVEDPNAGLLSEVPADFVPWSGIGTLADVRPSARANVYTAPPPLTIDPARSHVAVLTTGGGEIRVRLFADTAPNAVNNFVNLARDGYYDRTVFHRVMAEFMAQGGDPTGLGTGGPGYTFDDEFDGGPPLDRAGLLAMANTGPNTNGSQFFITVAPTEWLTDRHTVFGEVIEGQDVVDAIRLRDPDFPTGAGQVLDSIAIIEQ